MGRALEDIAVIQAEMARTFADLIGQESGPTGIDPVMRTVQIESGAVWRALIALAERIDELDRTL